jgi:signal transduction histidine kinase
VIAAWDQPDCPLRRGDASRAVLNCPALVQVSSRLSRPPEQVLGLALSREPANHAILAVCLDSWSALAHQTIDTLESMTAGLAMAIDRARFRVRERQLLQQVQRDVASDSLGLTGTLERMLADMVDGHPVEAAAVYLLRDGGSKLACVVSWPRPDAGKWLSGHALRAISTPAERPATVPDPSPTPVVTARRIEVIAVPIADEGRVQGVFVLAGRANATLPHRSVLDVVAGIMALLIRNSQLYARLETQAVLEERSHLAREVHDGLAQALGFFNFKVQHVQRLLGRGELDEAQAALQELRSGSQEVYDEVRQLVRDLSGPAEDAGDFSARLERYCQAFTRRTGLQVSLDAAPDIALGPEARFELFRVVQEALNNAQRHARASHVSVKLCQEPQGVALMITDDGAGMPATYEGGDHFGMQIMSQRVHSIGGDFKVMSGNGHGTTVHVRVPVEVAGEPREEGLWSAFVS